MARVLRVAFGVAALGAAAGCAFDSLAGEEGANGASAGTGSDDGPGGSGSPLSGGPGAGADVGAPLSGPADAGDEPGSSSGEESGASSSGGSNGGSSSGDNSSSGGNNSSSSSSSSSSSTSSSSGGSVNLGRCSGADVEPAAAAQISAFIDTLPYDQPTGTARDEVVDAILRTCEVFSPEPSSTWNRTYCWAHLVSAILKESSYTADMVTDDAYAKRSLGGGKKANDPTVGLLQIRFSATVRDFAVFGPHDKMACIGCEIPASFASHAGESDGSSFWSITGPTANMALMQKRACNIGLGAWYYYAHATSNGSASTTMYVDNYCTGATATAGNLITGLRSHLEGPDVGRGIIGTQSALNGLSTSDPYAYEYASEIKGFFDGMISVSGKHPFFVLLAPDAPRYCR